MLYQLSYTRDCLEISEGTSVESTLPRGGFGYQSVGA
jgi:hypothetical protein